MEEIETLGINSAQHFIESTSTITLKQQAKLWLKSLANRKRHPSNRRRSTTADMPWTNGCTRRLPHLYILQKAKRGEIQPYLKNKERDSLSGPLPTACRGAS